jgi:AcrR family transcriptional regulator
MTILTPPWRHPTWTASDRRPLSQQRIVDTALALLVREGIDAVSRAGDR